MGNLGQGKASTAAGIATALKPAAGQAAELFHAILLLLPWLNPFATGPSPAVYPWLLALACATVLWLQRVQLSTDLILRSWLAAASISAVIGLVQYGGWTHGLAPWVIATGPGEAFGNLRQRNQFATLLNIGLAATLWLVRRHDKVSPGQMTVWWMATVLMAAGIAASSSRTGFVQLLLLAGLGWAWGLWRHPRARRLLLTALLAYALASLALPVLLGQDAAGHGIWARLRQGDVACNVRMTLWANVLQLISARPWTGWGWGELDYAHFMTLYPGARFCEIVDNAHNLPLHLAVELGVPAALAVCALGVWGVMRLRPWRETQAERQVAWAVLGLILLHSMLEYPLWYGPFQIAVGLCVWILWRGREKSRALNVSGRCCAGEYGWAVGLLALTGYAAWDYHRISQIYLPEPMRAAAYRENTLVKLRSSWLFARQVRFAEFSITPLTRDNAEQMNRLAHELLHYSPEARVVEKLIESAVLLGWDDETQHYLLRYRAAYPQEHARWVARQTGTPAQDP